MTASQLKASILLLAITGKLVPQDPDDEPASEILQRLLSAKNAKKRRAFSSVATSEYGDINIEVIPFDVPDSWQWTCLDVACKMIGGKENQILAKDIAKEGLYPVVSQGKEFIDGYCNQGEKIIRDVPCVMFGDHTRNVKYIDFPFVIGADGTKFFKPLIDETLDEKYLYYWVSYTASQLRNKGYARHFGLLRASPIPLPPFAEQKRIVAKLEEVLPIVNEYGKLEENRRKLDADLPSALEKAILQDAIQGKLVPQDPAEGTAAELLEKIARVKPAQTSKGGPRSRAVKPTARPEDSGLSGEPPFEIPASWAWTRLSSLCDFYLGKTPPRGMMEFWNPQDVPWVSIADMTHCGHISTTKERVSSFAMESGAAGRLSPPGTLLMSFKLTIGKVSILDCAASHNEAIISIVPFFDDNFATRNYLFKVLPMLTQYAQSLSAIKGSTLNKKTLGEIPIPLPPLAEQKRIVAKVEQLLDAVRKLKTEADR